MGDKTRNKGEVRNHPTAFGIKKEYSKSRNIRIKEDCRKKIIYLYYLLFKYSPKMKSNVLYD